MLIAIISDIHDHIGQLRAALAQARAAAELICCGDLCSPFIIDELAKGFAGPIHIVFGNNDGDLLRIPLRAGPYGGRVRIYGEFVELVEQGGALLAADRDPLPGAFHDRAWGGRRIAVVHYDNIGRTIAAGGRHDAVCYGHSHRYEVTRDGATLRINPGEVMGGLTGSSSFVLYDTVTGEARQVIV